MSREIRGYEGIYAVDECGNVTNVKTGKQLKHQLNVGGYPTVMLTVNGSFKRVLVHRLVAIAFIPNPENKPEVNHKNGVRTDSRIENLEWNTKSENIKHSFEKLGKIFKPRKPVNLGDRFGMLTVVSEAPLNKHKQRMFICKCDCGSGEKSYQLGNLTTGNSFSCGCEQKRVTRERNYTNNPNHKTRRQPC